MTLPLAVLDTNVVLDWLVFRNPGVLPVVQAIEQGAMRWLGCPGIRAELAHVLLHAPLGGRRTDPEQVLTSVDRLMVMASTPSAMPLIRPRCSDPQDQIFIDLALAEGAQWLLSRDRAVLKLARKTRSQGLLIQRPEEWQWPTA